MDTTDDRLTMTPAEVGVRLGVSKASAYKAIASGEIPAIRVGRRLLVPRDAFEAMLTPTKPPAALKRRVLKRPTPKTAVRRTPTTNETKG